MGIGSSNGLRMVLLVWISRTAGAICVGEGQLIEALQRGEGALARERMREGSWSMRESSGCGTGANETRHWWLAMTSELSF